MKSFIFTHRPSVSMAESIRVLHVEDDGPGIPVADREYVFEAGFSTSAEGTRSGLQIV